ncbi:2-hydroxyacid dehydrogenase [Lentzea aerocolonigenes]|uniref:2-hydroxyacid dehydrogenase n=2 Tax=Lentzea aerocolonigenes TaxID=68170 RepID=A0A0F0HB86_LENAE|nr:2-hydroxyacid dehydrogenase [Lentzea aerocolonigenes]
MHGTLARKLFEPDALDRLARIADFDHNLVVDDFTTPEARAALSRAEIVVSSWGCPRIDAAVLASAPKLRAVVDAAGSVKGPVTNACWNRPLAVSSAAWANAIPVAEYTLAAILFAGKRVLPLSAGYRRQRAAFDWRAVENVPGNYRRVVGIVGASRVGRMVLGFLRRHDLRVLVHDPYLTREEACALGVKVVGLDELCALSDVVSIHDPALPEAGHLVDARRLALMRPGTTVINTARGSLVDQAALAAELRSGRLDAVLDVTTPDQLPSSLHDLPNVLLTPRVAGSHGDELHRLADAAIAEVARYAEGQPFMHPVLRRELDRTA